MTAYSLLPFYLHRMGGDQYLLTNLVGESSYLRKDELERLVNHQLGSSDPCFDDLVGGHFLMPAGTSVALDLLAAKYRTRRNRLPDFTALHIFVLTLRCTNNCEYCQISQRDKSCKDVDMSTETADQAIEFMFGSPSPVIKVEFQGGEPLLNFDLVRYITESCESRAASTDRRVEFVLCTNLSEFDQEYARYCRDHRIDISTSLDGPQDLHDQHRCGTYDDVISGIKLAREYVGIDHVSALMTPTRRSLGREREIVDEYVAQGFRSIFLRSLNPYGAAAANPQLSVSTDDWIDFYKNGLAYILELNEQGISIREEFAAILLRRMLTHDSGGFVDLQSPTGCGTAVLAYHHDGGIYLSDEARMLAEMGDHRFQLGTLGELTFDEAITDSGFVDLVSSTMNEAVPMCYECAFQSFCGSDPIGHYRQQGDVVGHKMLSAFCHRQMSVFEHLFRLLETPSKETLLSWL